VCDTTPTRHENTRYRCTHWRSALK